jgi:hypothetical protein
MGNKTLLFIPPVKESGIGSRTNLVGGTHDNKDVQMRVN